MRLGMPRRWQSHALRTELNKVARPGTRNSTRLLNLMPENTVFYAALPNLATTLSESHRIMQERIDQNPALRGVVGKKSERGEVQTWTR